MFLNKQRKKYTNFHNQKKSETKREGEINIKKNTSAQKSNDNLGEYVEFEELDDQEKDL